MQAFLSGSGTVPADWHVREERATGYSRIYYVRGGTVRYADAAESFALEPQTVYLFPNCAGYEMAQDPADPLDCLFFHAELSPRCVQRTLRARVRPGGVLYHLLAALGALEEGTPAGAPSQPAGESPAAPEAFPPAMRGALLEALAEALLAGSPGGTLPGRVQAVLCDIHANLADPALCVSALAGRQGQSETGLIRAFLAAVGMTPYQYILLHRMRTAAQLLAAGASAERTSLAVGYASPRAFACAFRRMYGTAPGRCRQFYRPSV